MDGMRRWIPDEATFNAMKYSWAAIITVTDEELTTYPLGDPLPMPEKPALPTLAETEAAVRAYFADIPVMISIAKCESTFRQYNNDGTPLRGSNVYIGIFQIDEKIHAAKAKGMGMDIYTMEGNMAYAKYLYTGAGTRPWKGCVPSVTPAPASTTTLTRDLKMGDDNSEVKIAQQLLNKAGYTIAASGPGSMGSETTYFGSMTKAAVQRFQCDKGIACTGSEATTGYGKVGPRTRAALLQTN
jgi:hypothetical protein